MHATGSSRSLLLSSDQTDSHVGIDMDSLKRDQQLQVIEQQVLHIVLHGVLLILGHVYGDTVYSRISHSDFLHSFCTQYCIVLRLVLQKAVYRCIYIISEGRSKKPLFRGSALSI